MRRHTDWDTPAFDLTPVASATGPFPTRSFLRTLWEHGGDGGRRLSLVEGPDALIPLEICGPEVHLSGHPDLVDYHAPLGPGVAGVMASLAADLPTGSSIDFDSLPLEAAEAVAEGLEAAGLPWTSERHAVAAVLELPGTYEDYLHAIGKKERHEVRRKRRRYVETVGELVHETHTGTGWAFDEFVRLHRLAAGPKGTFMTGGMRRLFATLAGQPGWRIDLLRIGEERRATACVFGFADEDGYFLYNSAYDPGLSEGSPGVALLGSMIERAIGEGRPRFDFLKGDEAYKFRLGADERPLYRLVAHR
ncbi:MAG: GNAT family N-acetyltransferase [Acidimicrobiia bacterium]|jgi:CelD/BcsL family acetyltransferase involved in cellulose biosynthesis